LAVWTLINIIFKKILNFSPKNPSSKNKEFWVKEKQKNSPKTFFSKYVLEIVKEN
jgi:hypothetical protein